MVSETPASVIYLFGLIRLLLFGRAMKDKDVTFPTLTGVTKQYEDQTLVKQHTDTLSSNEV